MQGGAPLFGMKIDPGPEPNFDLAHGQVLRLGEHSLEVRHCPGHTRGHVIFYCAQERLAFVGDVIFRGSIGRTDLPGGDMDTLVENIFAQVLTLPDETRLLSGHGEATTVQAEREGNPFLLRE
jgi:hydroxyacylglutathione hydrolase